MRAVTWTDNNGYKHRSLVREEDPDEAAPQGILQDPPVLEGMDWEAIKRDLHNLLVDAGLYSWLDVQQRQGLEGAILGAMRKKVIHLYREAEHG